MEGDDRQKKLQAGKERLAAFKKKKSRRKKKRDEFDDGTSEASMSETSSVASVIDMADMASLASDSEQNSEGWSGDSLDDDGTVSTELPVPSRALKTARRELDRAVLRITELEETMIGKQILLDSLVQENEQLKQVMAAQISTEKTDNTNDSGPLTNDVDVLKNKIHELEASVKERDARIQELSENLQVVSDNRDSLHTEYTSQAEQLAQQVQILQLQLKQAGEWLTGQLGERGISGQALLEAKNELLALQQVNQQKDTQITGLQAAIKERDHAINQMVERFNDSAHKFNILQQANLSLQQETRTLKQEKSSAASQASRLHRDLVAAKSELEARSNELARVRGEVDVLRGKYDAWEALEDELTLVRRKEKESSAVIQQLMADIENLQKGGIARMKLEGVEAISVEQHKQDIEALRAELDELHGDQVVQLKEQLGDSHKQEMDKIGRELVKIKAERNNLTSQVEDWQKMYVKLSQAGISDADLTLEIQTLKNENAKYKLTIDELGLDVQALRNENEWLKAEKSVQHERMQKSGGVEKSQDRYSKEVAKNEELKRNIVQLERNLVDIKQSQTVELQKLTEKIESLTVEKESLSKQLDSLRLYQENIEKEHSKELGVMQEQNVEAVKLAKEQLENELAVTRQALQVLQSSAKSKTQKSSAQADIEVLSKAQQEQIRELQAKYSSETAELKSRLAEVQNELLEKNERVVEIEELLASNLELYTKDRDTLNDTIEGLKRDVETQKDDGRILKESLQSALIEKDEMMDRFEEKRLEIESGYEQKIAKLNQEHKGLIEVMNGQVQQSQKRSSPLHSEDSELGKKLKSAQEERDFFKQQLEQLSVMMSGEGETKELEEKCSRLEKQAESFAEEKLELTEQVQKLTEKMKTLSDGLRESEAPRKELEALGSEIQGFRAQYEELQGENEKLKAYYQHASGENQTLREHIENINVQYNELSTQYQALTAKYQADVLRLSTASSDERVMELSARVEEMEKAEEELMKERDSNVSEYERMKEELRNAAKSTEESNIPVDIPSSTVVVSEKGTDVRIKYSALLQRYKELNARHETLLVKGGETVAREELKRVIAKYKALLDTYNELAERKGVAKLNEDHVEMLGLGAEYVGQTSKDVDQASKDGGQVLEDVDQTSKDVDQSSKDGGKTSKGGGQTSKDGGQTSKDVGQTSIHISQVQEEVLQKAENIGHISQEVGQNSQEVGQIQDEQDKCATLVPESEVDVCETSRDDSASSTQMYEALMLEISSLKTLVESKSKEYEALMEQLCSVNAENCDLKRKLEANSQETVAASSVVEVQSGAGMSLESDILSLMKALSTEGDKLDLTTTHIPNVNSTPEIEAEMIEALKSFVGNEDSVVPKRSQEDELVEAMNELVDGGDEDFTIEVVTRNPASSEQESSLLSLAQAFGAQIVTKKDPPSSLDEAALAFVNASKPKDIEVVREDVDIVSQASTEASPIEIIDGMSESWVVPDIKPEPNAMSYLQEAMTDQNTAEQVPTCKTQEEFDTVIDTAASAFTSIRKPVPRVVQAEEYTKLEEEMEQLKKMYVESRNTVKELQGELLKYKGAISCDTEVDVDTQEIKRTEVDSTDKGCDIAATKDKSSNEKLDEVYARPLSTEENMSTEEDDKPKSTEDATSILQSEVDASLMRTEEHTRELNTEEVLKPEEVSQEVLKQRMKEMQHLCHALQLDNDRLKSKLEEVRENSQQSPVDDTEDYSKLSEEFKRLQEEKASYEEKVKVLLLSKDNLQSDYEAEVEALKRSQADAMRDVDEQFDALNNEIESANERLKEALKREEEAREAADEVESLREDLVKAQEEVEGLKGRIESSGHVEVKDKEREGMKEMEKDAMIQELTKDLVNAQEEVEELQGRIEISGGIEVREGMKEMEVVKEKDAMIQELTKDLVKAQEEVEELKGTIESSGDVEVKDKKQEGMKETEKDAMIQELTKDLVKAHEEVEGLKGRIESSGELEVKDTEREGMKETEVVKEKDAMIQELKKDLVKAQEEVEEFKGRIESSGDVEVKDKEHEGMKEMEKDAMIQELTEDLVKAQEEVKELQGRIESSEDIEVKETEPEGIKETEFVKEKDAVIQELTKDLVKAQEEVKELEGRIESSGDLEVKDTEREGMKEMEKDAKIQELTKDLVKAQEEVKELKGRIKSSENKEVKDKEQEGMKETEVVKEKDAMIQELMERCRVVEEELIVKSADVDVKESASKLMEELDKAHEELKQVQEKKNEVQELHAELQKDKDGIKEELENFKGVNDELLKRKQELDNEIEAMKNSKEELEVQVADVRNKLKDSEKIVEELKEGSEDQVKDLLTRLKESEVKMDDLKTVLRENEKDLSEKLKEIEGKHVEEIKEIERKHKEEIKEIEGKHVEEIKEFEEKSEDKMKEIDGKHEETVKEIEGKHVEEIKEIEGKHEEEIKEIEGLHENKVKEIEGSQKEEMKKKEGKNEDQIKELTEKLKDLEETKEEMKKEEEKKLDEIASATKALSTEKDALVADMSALRQNFETLTQERDANKKKSDDLEKDVEKFKSQGEKLKAKLRQSIEKQVENAKKLSEKNEENEEMRKKMKELNEEAEGMKEELGKSLDSLEKLKVDLDAQKEDNQKLLEGKESLGKELNVSMETIKLEWEEEVKKVVSELSDVKAEKEALEGRIDGLQKEFEGMKDKNLERMKELECEVETLKDEKLQVEVEMGESLKEANTLRGKLEKEIDAMKDERKDFQRNCDELEGTVKDLKERLEVEKSLRDASATELSSKLEKVIEENEVKIVALEKARSDIEVEKRTAEDLVEVLRKEKEESARLKVDTEAELMTRIQNLEIENLEVLKQKEKCEVEVDAVRGELEESHVTVERLNAEVKGAHSEKQELELEIAKGREEVERVLKECAEVKERNQNLSGKIDELDAQNKTAEELIENLRKDLVKVGDNGTALKMEYDRKLQCLQDEKESLNVAYEMVKTECQELGGKNLTLEEKLKGAEESFEKVVLDLKKEITAKDALEVENAEVKTLLDDVHRELGVKKDEIAENLREIEALKGESSSKMVEFANLQTSCSEVSGAMDDMKAELETGIRRNEEKEKEVEGLETQIATLKVEFDETIAKKQAELSNLQTMVSRFSSENAIMREDKEAIDSQIQHLDNECKTLQKVVAQSNSEQERYKDEVSTLKEKLQDVILEKEKASDLVKNLEENVKDQFERLTIAEKEKLKTAGEIDMFKVEVDGLLKEKAELEGRIDDVLNDKERVGIELKVSEESLNSLKVAVETDRVEFASALDKMQKDVEVSQEQVTILRHDLEIADVEMKRQKETHEEIMLQKNTEMENLIARNVDECSKLKESFEQEMVVSKERHSVDVESIRRNYDETISEMVQTLGAEKGDIAKEYEHAMEMIREKQLLLGQAHDEIASLRVEKESADISMQRKEREWTEKLEEMNSEIEDLRRKFAEERKEAMAESERNTEEMLRKEEEKMRVMLEESNAEKEELRLNVEERDRKVVELEATVQEVKENSALKMHEMELDGEKREKELKEKFQRQVDTGEDVHVLADGGRLEKQIEELTLQNQSLTAAIGNVASPGEVDVNEGSEVEELRGKIAVIEAEKGSVEQQYRNMVEMANGQMQQLVGERNGLYGKLQEALERISQLEGVKQDVEGVETGQVAGGGQESGQVAGGGPDSGQVTGRGQELGQVTGDGPELGQVTGHGQELGQVTEDGQESGQVTEGLPKSDQDITDQSQSIAQQDGDSNPVLSVTAAKPDTEASSNGESLGTGKEMSVSADSLEVILDGRDRTLSADSLDESSPAPRELIKAVTQKTQGEPSDQASVVVQNDLVALEEERSMLQASVDNLRATMSDMQQNRGVLEEEHELLQEELELLKARHAAMVEADDSGKVLKRYESEISKLTASLRTMQEEREAMKETFEEDLGRLNNQLYTMEQSRAKLEKRLQSLHDKHPELVESSSSGEESSTRGSTPGFGSLHPPVVFTPEESFPSSAEMSANVSPSHLRNPDLIAAMLQAGLAGVKGGMFSDSVQLEQRLATAMQAQQQQSGRQPGSGDVKAARELFEVPKQSQGLLGFASDSVQYSAASTMDSDVFDVAKDGGIDVVQNVESQRLPASTEPLTESQRISEKPLVESQCRPTESSTTSSSSVAPPPPSISSLQARLAAVQEQHATELRILEWRLSEGHAAALTAARTEAEERAQEEYAARHRAVDDALAHRIQALEAQSQHAYIEELQKVRGELETGYKQSLERMRSTYEDSTLHQVSQGDVQYKLDQLVNKLTKDNKKLSEAHVLLLSQVDQYHHEQQALQEKLQTLLTENEYLSAENVRLYSERDDGTDGAPDSERHLHRATGADVKDTEDTEETEWRVRYQELVTENATLRERLGTESSVTGTNDAGKEGGSFTLEGSDAMETVLKLEQENAKLKSQIEEANLGRQEAGQEELIELRSKYEEVIKEKDVLVNRLRASGQGNQSGDFALETSAVVHDERHPLEAEDSLAWDNMQQMTSNSLEEDFIDWKLKYEVIEKENQSLRCRIDSEVSQGMMENVSTPKSPKSGKVFEFKSQHDLLVEQNELLRAQLGAHGIFTERSLEGDVLDPQVKMTTLQAENREMKARIRTYESRHSDDDGDADQDSSWQMLQEIQQEMVELRKQLQQTEQEKQELACEIAKMVKGDAEEGDGLAEKLRVTQKENKDLVDRIMELEAEVTEFRTKDEEIHVKGHAQETSHDRVVSVDQITKELQESNEERSKLMQKLADIESKAQEFKEKSEEQEEKEVELWEKMGKGDEETKELSRKLIEAESKCQKLSEDLDEAEKKSMKLKEICSESEQGKENLRVNFEKLQLEYQRLKTEIEGGFSEDSLKSGESLSVEMESMKKENEELVKKLQEATVKLESFEQSVDSTGEAATQIETLKSEAKKAKKDYTKLKAKFVSANRENDKLQSRIKELEENLPDVEREVVQQAGASAVSSRKSSMSSALSLETTASVQDLEKELNDVKEERGKLQKAKEDLGQQLEMSKFERQQGPESVNKKMQTRLQKLEKQHKKLQEEHEALRTTRVVTSSDYDSEAIQKQNADLRKEIQQLKDWTKTEEVNMAASVQKLEGTVTQLQKQLEKAENAKGSISGSFEDMKSQYKELSQQYEATKGVLETLQFETEASKIKLAETDKERESLTAENEKLTKQLNKHSVSVDELRVRVCELEGENAKLKNQHDVTDQSSVVKSTNTVDRNTVEKGSDDSKQGSDQVCDDSKQADAVEERLQMVMGELSDLQSVHDTVLDENRGLMFEVERLETELADLRFQMESSGGGDRQNGVKDLGQRSDSDAGVLSDQGMVVDVQTVKPIGVETSTPIAKKKRSQKGAGSIAEPKGSKATNKTRPVPSTPSDGRQKSKEADLRKQIEKLQKENKVLGSKLSESASKSETELNKVKKRLENVTKERKDLQMRFDREVSHGSNVSLSSTSSKTKKTDGRGKSSTKDKEISELRFQLEQKDKENSDMMRIIHQSGNAPAELSETKMQFEILLAEKKNMILQFEEEKAKLQEDIEELTERADLLEKEKAEMIETDVEALKQEDGDVNIQRMRKHLEELVQENQKVKAEKDEMEEKFKRVAEEKREVKIGIMNEKMLQQQKVNDLTAKSELLEQERNKLKSDCQSLMAEKNKISSELEERLKCMEERLRCLEEENARLQEQAGKDASEVDGTVQSPVQSPQSQHESPMSRPRSSSSLLSVAIPDLGSPAASTRSHSPAMSTNVLLYSSASELSVQYELLLAEKHQLCTRLEEADRKARELRLTIRQFGLQTEKLQQELEQYKHEAETQRIQHELLMDEKAKFCSKLSDQKTVIKDLKLKLATVNQQVVQLERDADRAKKASRDISEIDGLREGKSLLSVQLEKADQDLEILKKELEKSRVQYETSLAESKEKATGFELQLNRERANTKSVKEELEEVNFRYEELRILTQRSSSNESLDRSPRDMNAAKKSLKELQAVVEKPHEEDVRQELAIANEQILKLNSELANLQKPYDLLLADHAELAAKLRKSEEEVTKVNDQLVAVREELKDVQEQVSKLGEENETLRMAATDRDRQLLDENARLKEALDDCVTTRAKLREQVKDLMEELERMKSRHERDSEEMEKMVDRIEAKEDEVDKKTDENRKLMERVEELESGSKNSNEVPNDSVMVDSSSATTAGLQKEVTDACAKASRLDAELTLLRENHAKTEARLESVEMLLDQAYMDIDTVHDESVVLKEEKAMKELEFVRLNDLMLNYQRKADETESALNTERENLKKLQERSELNVCDLENNNDMVEDWQLKYKQLESKLRSEVESRTDVTAKSLSSEAILSAEKLALEEQVTMSENVITNLKAEHDVKVETLEKRCCSLEKRLCLSDERIKSEVEALNACKVELEGDKIRRKELQDEMVRADTKLQACNERIEELEKVLEARTEELHSKEQEVTEMSEALDHEDEKRNELMTKLKVAQDEIRKVKENLIEAGKHDADAQKTLEEEKGKVAKYEQNASCIRSDLEDIQCTMDSAISELQQENEKLSEENLEAKELLSQRDAEITDLKQTVEKLNSENERLVEEVEEMREKLRCLSEELEGILRRNSDLDRKYQQQVNELEEKVMGMEYTEGTLRTDKERLKETLHEIEKDAAVFKAQVEVLQQVHESKTNVNIEKLVQTAKLEAEIDMNLKEKSKLEKDLELLGEKNLTLEKNVKDLEVKVVELKSKCQLLQKENETLVANAQKKCFELDATRVAHEKALETKSHVEETIQALKLELSEVKSKLEVAVVERDLLRQSATTEGSLMDKLEGKYAVILDDSRQKLQAQEQEIETERKSFANQKEITENTISDLTEKLRVSKFDFEVLEKEKLEERLKLAHEVDHLGEVISDLRSRLAQEEKEKYAMQESILKGAELSSVEATQLAEKTAEIVQLKEDNGKMMQVVKSQDEIVSRANEELENLQMRHDEVQSEYQSLVTQNKQLSERLENECCKTTELSMAHDSKEVEESNAMSQCCPKCVEIAQVNESLRKDYALAQEQHQKEIEELKDRIEMMTVCKESNLKVNEAVHAEMAQLVSSSPLLHPVNPRISEHQKLDEARMPSPIHAVEDQVPPAKADDSEAKVDQDNVDLSLMDLQEENNRLYKVKTELEDQVMGAKAEQEEMRKLVKVKEVEFEKQVEELEHRVADGKSMIEAVQSAKENLEKEMLKQREEFENRLARSRLDALEKHVKDPNERERIVSQIAEAEKKTSGLQDRLRSAQEEKALLQLKIVHHGRECKLYERHIKDLETEVEVQQAQIHEALAEHKETIRMLAEMRLEQAAMRQQQAGEFSRIDGKIQCIESQLSSSILSTPYSLSIASRPESRASGSRADSVHSFDEVPTRGRSDTQESEDPGYTSQAAGSRGQKLDDQGYRSRHFRMAEQISKLHKELKEAKDNHKKEVESLKAMLKNKIPVEETAQEQTTSAKDQDVIHSENQQEESDTSSMHDKTLNENPEEEFIAETYDISLQEQMITLQRINRQLLEENQILQQQVSDSQYEISKLYVQLENCTCLTVDKASAESIIGNQLLLLQSQNSELYRRLEEQKETQWKNSELLVEKKNLEGQLRSEKESARQKRHEKEKIEIELLRERIFLEKQIKEYQKLEELMHSKELYEKELKEKLEEAQGKVADSSEMVDSGLPSDTLGESSDVKPKKLVTHTETIGNTTQRIQYVGYDDASSAGAIQHEAGKLYVEIRRKMRYRDVRTQVGKSALRCLPGETPVPLAADSLLFGVRTSKAYRPSRWTKLECGCTTDLETMKMYAQCKYHSAVEKLRKDLKRIDARKREIMASHRE